MLPPKLQLLAVLTFGVAVLFLENQIQKLEESRGKLGECERARARGQLGRERRWRGAEGLGLLLWLRDRAGESRGHKLRGGTRPKDQKR